MTKMICLICGREINRRRSRRGWYHINVRMHHWAIPDYSRYNRENPKSKLTPDRREYIYLITAIIGAITAIVVLFREWR